MKTCHGCNHPLEPLAAVRTYHAGCDPRGRVEMLERTITAFLADWDNPSRLELSGHHVMGTVMIEALNGLRAALAYKPAQMKEREG